MPIVINGKSYPSTINSVSSDMPHGTYYMADNNDVYELQRSNSFCTGFLAEKRFLFTGTKLLRKA